MPPPGLCLTALPPLCFSSAATTPRACDGCAVPPSVGAVPADGLLTFELLKVTWMLLNPCNVQQPMLFHVCVTGKEQHQGESSCSLGDQ